MINTLKNLRDVKFLEHTVTNGHDYVIAHLTCGHTRTFHIIMARRGLVRCWECDRLDEEKQ